MRQTPLTAAQIRLRSERQSLELSRTRVLNDLESTTHARHVSSCNPRFSIWSKNALLSTEVVRSAEPTDNSRYRLLLTHCPRCRNLFTLSRSCTLPSLRVRTINTANGALAGPEPRYNLDDEFSRQERDCDQGANGIGLSGPN
jgi:hypothetical protein